MILRLDCDDDGSSGQESSVSLPVCHEQSLEVIAPPTGPPRGKRDRESAIDSNEPDPDPTTSASQAQKSRKEINMVSCLNSVPIFFSDVFESDVEVAMSSCF